MSERNANSTQAHSTQAHSTQASPTTARPGDPATSDVAACSVWPMPADHSTPLSTIGPVTRTASFRITRAMGIVTVAAGLVLALSACSSEQETLGQSASVDQASQAANPDGNPDETSGPLYAGYSSSVYVDDDAWLCRPDRSDVCDEDLTVEVITADGERTTEPFTPAVDPGVDCFYVYPTVSNDPTANSDLVPDGGEITAVRAQAARLAESCRVWAPMYRQATLGTIASRISGADEGASEGADEATTTTTGNGTTTNGQGDVEAKPPSDIAYATMVDAFRHYMANENDGRGIVLVGHSQGTGLLARLLAEEFAAEPQLNDQLVSAVLAGLSVPEDAFDGIGVCTSPTDTGCFMAWASYRSDVAPTAGALFGRNPSAGRATCTSPADLTGGSGPLPLTPVFETSQAPGTDGWVMPGAGSPPQAPWVALPGLVTGECVERDGYHFLEITVVPDEVRASDVPGDLTPQWGLHLVDMNLVMGNLTEVVATQTSTWLANR